MDRFEHGRKRRSGSIFAVGATPRLPASAPARSERISACRLVATMVSGLGMQRHTVRHGIDQHFVPLHIREFLRHFSGNLIPHHHTMALGVGFGHHGQQFTWTRLCQSEGIAHNACHPTRVKIATSVPTSSGKPRWVRPPLPEYSPSEFSRTMTQSRSPCPRLRSGEVTPGRILVGRTLAYWSKPGKGSRRPQSVMWSGHPGPTAPK